MKQSALWTALFTLGQLALVAMKLDGLTWPWWSWNPLAVSVLIIQVWLFYVVAAALVLVNLGAFLVWLGRKAAPKG